MSVSTTFTHNDFIAVLSQYDLGAYTHSQPIQQGTVQTNYFIETTQGKFVFRYYENRSRESVLFESDLIQHLVQHQYPCPAQIKNRAGAYVGTYHSKPFVIFQFIDGHTQEKPNIYHWRQLIQKAAELQILTQDFHSPFTPYRSNYSPDLCRKLAHDRATRRNTQDAQTKFAWLVQELTTLDLPPSSPKGICHCDFHFSNVLFKGNELVTLLDFDDANYTYLQFDLVGLIEYWAWPHRAARLDLPKVRTVVQEYTRHRPFAPIERQHLFDVYKLSILFDCVWYFDRGAADDFNERRKIEVLNEIGRQEFFTVFEAE